ncbi:DUF6000 family protein, partial [Spirillospora sp. NPDC048819]|uniref:DUF6000 family protein n=1 Tax=Spirillospora sp. NPDC048819 TaxID=3155268 RepID=UPI0033DE6076
MSQGPQRDEGNEEPIRRYVHALSDPEEPRWRELLHGNFERLPETERRPFLHTLARDARQITDTDLEFMLYPGQLAGWRERLTAAWLIGLSRRTRFRESL